jgi:hypothetical protein
MMLALPTRSALFVAGVAIGAVLARSAFVLYSHLSFSRENIPHSEDELNALGVQKRLREAFGDAAERIELATDEDDEATPAWMR